MRPGDVFVLLPGWQKSAGTKAEAALAFSQGLTIAEWLPTEKKPRKLARAGLVIKEVLA
jgi:hypothetical protein